MRNRDGTKAELMLKTHKLGRRSRAEGNLERMTAGRRRSGASVHVPHFWTIKSTLPWDWWGAFDFDSGIAFEGNWKGFSLALFFPAPPPPRLGCWDAETIRLDRNLHVHLHLFQDKAEKHNRWTEHCTRFTSRHRPWLFFCSSFQNSARCDVTRGSPS